VDPLLPFAIFGLVVTVVGIAAYLAYRAEQKRRQLLQGFAASSGWTYTARDDSWTARFEGGPFGQGERLQHRAPLLVRLVSEEGDREDEGHAAAEDQQRHRVHA
jgi:hypothetical protein